MRLVPHDDLGEFVREVMPWIEHEPVRHNLIATLLSTRVSGAHPVEDGILLWAVVDGQDGMVGVAIQTPPMPMVITDMPAQALEVVAEAARSLGLQRFHGPGARRLAELVAGNEPVARARGSALHRLERVIPPLGVPGRARWAEPGEAALVHEWVLGFQSDVGDEEPIHLSHVEGRIGGRRIWVWEDDDRPVAMAAWTEPVHAVVRVNLVYTPPPLRGRGYASALVAAISQAVLDRGDIPILYTDLANPTSNKIYAAIGYEKIEEVELWETFPSGR